MIMIVLLCKGKTFKGVLRLFRDHTRCENGVLVGVKQAAIKHILLSVRQRHDQRNAKTSRASLDEHHTESIDDNGAH
jgi:hypothetical protein